MNMRMAMPVVAWIVLALAAEAKDPIRDSVVKIHSTQRMPDFCRPWTKATPRDGVGSGAVIEGNRILTAAHVVTYATEIYVQVNESTDKVPAHVEAMAPDMDLALPKIWNRK
jgi:S1-C subfamily serine protease